MAAPGHGVSPLNVIGAADAPLVGPSAVCGKGGCIAVALVVAGLNLFLGVALFIFFCGVTFSNVRIGFWEWGSKLVDQCWDYWFHLVFHFQESFHLFNNVRVQAEFSGPMHAPNQLGCSIPFENVHPLH